jgi:hypothetical protein
VRASPYCAGADSCPGIVGNLIPLRLRLFDGRNVVHDHLNVSRHSGRADDLQTRALRGGEPQVRGLVPHTPAQQVREREHDHTRGEGNRAAQLLHCVSLQVTHAAGENCVTVPPQFCHIRQHRIVHGHPTRHARQNEVSDQVSDTVDGGVVRADHDRTGNGVEVLTRTQQWRNL